MRGAKRRSHPGARGSIVWPLDGFASLARRLRFWATAPVFRLGLKLFANFFQAFSKLFANFRGFSPSFSKFLFGGFGEFQRVRGQKIWRQGFSVFSKFLSPPRRGIFAQGSPTGRRSGRRRSSRFVKQLEFTLPEIVKKQKAVCGFFGGATAADPCADAGAVLATRRRWKRRAPSERRKRAASGLSLGHTPPRFLRGRIATAVERPLWVETPNSDRDPGCGRLTFCDKPPAPPRPSQPARVR